MSSGANARITGPFVLLHGFAQTPASWDQVAALLAKKGCEVHAPFLMELAWGQEPVSLERLCAALAGFVRSVGIDAGRPPVLVGYSMGGRIAAQTVALHQDLPVAAVVLESAGLGPRTPQEREKLRHRNADWAKHAHENGTEAFMQWWESLPLFASQQALPQAVRDRQRVERLSYPPADLAVQLEAWGQHNQLDWGETAACLQSLAQRVPVAYFAGEEDAKYCGKARELAQAATSVRVCVFPQVGHNIHLEDPIAFTERLCEVSAER